MSLVADVHVALTTIDNPYSPFDQWDEWRAFDEAAGYNTSALLARVARTSDELSESDQELALNDAMNEVIWMNDTGLYRLVTASDFKVRAEA